MVNIVYVRVSHKKENDQDLEHQKEVLLHKFKPENPIILEEKGSAYFLENVQNRDKFIEILNLCFENKGVTEIFLQNYTKKDINIYVWDLNRIMRNLKFNLFFSVLASIHDVRIYSYHDTDLHKHSGKNDDSYDEEFIRLLLAVLSAKKAEDYSRDVSKNTKKAFVKALNSSYSKDGLKVGTKFKDAEGNPVDLGQEVENEMYEFIVSKIRHYKSNNISCFYPFVIKAVLDTYNVKISSAYLSKVNKRLDQ
jgi:DNA invertase Pin-like site-specific DNA recombinase